MQQEHEGRLEQIVQYCWSTLAAVLVVVVYRFVIHANQTTVALTFLILILFTAFRRALAYSVYLSILCTVLYNFYFLPPVGSFTISDPQNLVALLAFLVAGISVNHISAKERRQAHSLALQGEEIEKLYAFSRRLLLEDKLQELSRSLPGLIAHSLQLRAVALYLPDREDAWMWDPEDLMAGMETLHDATQPTGVSSRSSEGIRIVPLLLGMRAIGVLAMAESGYSESFYDAIGSLTAVAIERASAVERNSRSEAAREGELLRTALLDSITHELRTPLTGIRIAATTLAENDGLQDEARQDLVSVINEESKRMDALIDEAVTMAKIGAGDFSLRKEPHSLKRILATVLDNLQLQLRGRSVTERIAEDVPEILLDGDLMRRVLKHLIENAIQYSPPRTPIVITAEVVRDKLLVSVANEGPGIAEDEQAYVFDRFFRGAHGNAHPNGTGMGLAIVKAIVEAHQGKVSVRSTPGHGATFSFWIPVVVDD